MTLGVLTNADIPALALLEKECFTDAWGENAWKEEFSRADFFGYSIREEDTLIGYACGTSLFEESELLRIAVAPDFRKKGYGAVLLEALFQGAKKRGAEKMFLEVRENNAPARGLYEKNGFTQTRVRKRYYENGENAVEMVKSLNKE